MIRSHFFRIMHIKKYLIFLLLFFAPSLIFPLNLKEKFTYAKKGDYIVTEQNKTYTLLHIHTINGHKLILEEISIPSHQLKQKQFNWKKWVLEGAKGHTSWIAYEIDLQNDKIIECYSFNKKTFLAGNQIDSFLMILFKLDLKDQPDLEKRRIGPPPPPGEIDYRKIWNPPLYFNGKQVASPKYHACQSIWPKDETELSGKEIILYFDQENELFPFPYWIQIADGSLKFKIRTVDSGTNLQSPFKELPRKAFYWNSASSNSVAK